MLTHTVLFWLKDELSAEEIEEFRAGLDTLHTIDAAKEVHWGTPALADRPIVDRSYDFGLCVLLDDMNAHDEYQAHKIHQDFLEAFGTYWRKIVIYDID